MIIRRAEPSEASMLARIWHEGWRDAHVSIVPEALTRIRTLESFEERMIAGIGDVWVAGALGAPLGFYVLNGDELDLLFVSAQWRGRDVAPALIADAEERLREGGTRLARLDCVIGNERAARFYEKHGWRRGGTVSSRLETTAGLFELDMWRYEKRLDVVEIGADVDDG